MNSKESFETRVRNFQGKNTGQRAFWFVAHQLGANSLEQITEVLSNEPIWTGRNVMSYRYLGLITKRSGTTLQLTDAGSAFLQGSKVERAEILDCQIAKFFLANPTNPKMKISVFPFAATLELLCELRNITPSEYLNFVIWIHNTSEIQTAISLIWEYRGLTHSERQKLTEATEKYSGSADLWGQVNRLYWIIAAHSAIAKDEKDSLSLSVTQEDAELYLRSITRDLPKPSAFTKAFMDEPLNLGPVPSPSSRVIPPRPKSVFLDPIPSPPKLDVPATGEARIRQIDYVALAAAQRIAGHRAEQFVLDQEISRLEKLGDVPRASQVRQVSVDNDSLGYDILTFVDGEEVHVEVKGVAKLSGVCSIFLSPNEVRTAQRDSRWQLWIVLGNNTATPFIWKSLEIAQAIRDAQFKNLHESDEVAIRASEYEIRFNVRAGQ